MGSLKDEWMDRQDEDADKKLAEILGITYSELQQTVFRRDTNESKDGLVYHELIVFDPDKSSKDVLNKISGIDENYTVWLDPSLFAGPDDDN